ncbi:MAG: sigma 54-interacting transcriptional regulator [Fibrobacterota bacterium]
MGVDKESAVKNIIGESAEAVKLRSILKKTAAHRVNILITGETGCGKEMAARTIHKLRSGDEGHFVIINCSALPESLFDAELSGTAYDGRDSKKQSSGFTSADTIFFDEIGDLSSESQAKLLRFMEKKKKNVLAASGNVLIKKVSEGSFRADLFHRINEIGIDIPPLRNRRKDIPVLCEHFMEMFSRDFGGESKKMSDASLSLLMKYDWPGNVRELRNVLKKAILLSESQSIWIEDLPLITGFSGAAPHKEQSFRPLTLKDLEKEHIENTLKFTGWNKKKASEFLGIDRTSLYNKISKYEIKEG